MARALAANAFVVILLAMLGFAGVLFWAEAEVDRPGPTSEDVLFTVATGENLRSVSERLAAEGVVSNAMLFRLTARRGGQDRALKFGEYEIPAAASMNEILDKLVSGDSVQHRVTLAEGLTSWEMVQILLAEERLTGEIEDIPAEGALAPDTYLFQRGDSRQSIIDRMIAAQTRFLAEAWEARSADVAVDTPEDLLILASIIEKETGVAEERGTVASVFTNRLKRGMRLQTDPTVIYGITLGRERLGRGLRRSELDASTPYNTYVIAGLPPTPIANPGRASIIAAAQPDSTDYLYFVADGTGGHTFSRTLDEHNRAVARWRQIEAERAAQ